jgi:hypothetical protein
VKSKARIQTHNSLVLDDVLCCLESALGLVVGCGNSCDVWLGDARVISICHEDRDLGAELG